MENLSNSEVQDIKNLVSVGYDYNDISLIYTITLSEYNEITDNI